MVFDDIWMWWLWMIALAGRPRGLCHEDFCGFLCDVSFKSFMTRVILNFGPASVFFGVNLDWQNDLYLVNE